MLSDLAGLSAFAGALAVFSAFGAVLAGFAAAFVFVALVLAAYMSVSAQALIAGSPALVAVMVLLLGASLVLIIAGKFRKTKSKPAMTSEGKSPVD